jgi:hypothetical protein
MCVNVAASGAERQPLMTTTTGDVLTVFAGAAATAAVFAAAFGWLAPGDSPEQQIPSPNLPTSFCAGLPDASAVVWCNHVVAP